jgi:hypothetical protein
MAQYNPDHWRILKVKLDGNDLYYRIISTWHGSYLSGESWKISSPIVDVKDEGNRYLTTTHTGSVYELMKYSESENSYLENTYNYYMNLCIKEYPENPVFEKISMEEFLGVWYGKGMK